MGALHTERVQSAGARELQRPGGRQRRDAGDNDNLPITVTSTDPEARDAAPDQANVRLQLEEIREQALPVRVNLIGQVPSGYQPGQATVDPAQIKVAGAASLVGRATEAVVDVSARRSPSRSTGSTRRGSSTIAATT